VLFSFFGCCSARQGGAWNALLGAPRMVMSNTLVGAANRVEAVGVTLGTMCGLRL